MSCGSAAKEMTVPPGGPTCLQVCAFDESAKTDAEIASARIAFFICAILPERRSADKSRFRTSLENDNRERCCPIGQNADKPPSVLVLSHGETPLPPPSNYFSIPGLYSSEGNLASNY